MNYFFQNNSNKSKSLEDSYYHLKYFYHINIDELNTDAMSRDLQNSLMDNKVVIDLKSSKDLPGNLSRLSVVGLPN